jgi:hypothetical protein
MGLAAAAIGGIGAAGAALGTGGAILGAGVLGAGASLATGAMNAGAASSAANAQAAQAANSLALQKQEFGVVQNNLAPYMTAGQGALTQFGNLTGANGRPTRSISLRPARAIRRSWPTPRRRAACAAETRTTTSEPSTPTRSRASIRACSATWAR